MQYGCEVVTADKLVKEGGGTLAGLFCSAAASTPTLKIWDNTAASGKILIDTFTPVAGTSYPLPAGGITFTNGLYIDIGNTVTVSVFYV